MTINYNVAGPERKRLAQVIAKELGIDAIYKGAPSFNYEMNYFTLSKDGALDFDDEWSGALDTERVLTAIELAGFETEDEQLEDTLTISMPIMEGEEISRLEALIESKESLIRKALEVDSLPVIENEGKFEFPWFKADADPDEVNAYMLFITALCRMAKEAKRVNGKDHPVDNEKYAFRCFLLRLGFIGDEYKAARKILLRNLSGSSAFRDGGKNDEISK